MTTFFGIGDTYTICPNDCELWYDGCKVWNCDELSTFGRSCFGFNKPFCVEKRRREEL